MKIRIFTGLFPTTRFPYGGIFVYERLKQLQNLQIPFDVWITENRYSKIVHVMYKIFMKRSLDTKVEEWDLENRQHNVSFNISSILLGLSYLYPSIYLKKMKQTMEWSMSFLDGDILHAHWVYPHGYIATCLAKEHNIPCVITAHGSDIHTTPWNSKIIKKYTLKTLNSADKVIFVSHALLDSAKKLGYSGENAIVIPNGIDLSYFHPMGREEAMKKIGWTQTKRYVVGFVGNLIPVKRADKFVEIFSEIRKLVQDVEFILVGDGDLKDDIRSGASDAGLTVTFAGRVPHEDVCCWMNLFDVMILPSRNEGWPCVVLEAFACGTPVVGSQNGGIAEAIDDLCPVVIDGDLFEEEFAMAVCNILENGYYIDSNILIGRANSYTWEKTIKSEIELYQSCFRVK